MKGQIMLLSVALSMHLLPQPTLCAKQTIYFGAFLSNLFKDELCFKAAIDTAVQLVNRDETLLKGFHLKIKYFDNFVSLFVFLSCLIDPFGLSYVRTSISFVGTSMSSVGTSMSYVGTSMSYVGTSMSYVGTSMSYVGTSMSFK